MIHMIIDGTDYTLRHGRERAGAIIDHQREGGYLLAEIVAVHTHECLRRRWGRKNHGKPCNCGAAELAQRYLG